MTQKGLRKPLDKIKTIEELAEILESLRANDKKVVHCHGVFDLLHIGHIRHFNLAKKHGDILVVTVTPDRYVNKGPHRPAFTEHLRAEAIAALDCVDYAAINEWPTAIETIEILKPDIYAKGSDYRDAQKDHTGKIVDEEAAVKSVGGEIVFTEDIVFSSSSLINKYMSVLSQEMREYISRFSEQYSVNDVLHYLQKAESLKVLVVGETIIDEYQYCATIGKSAKEPILAAQYLSSEKFAGGVVAVANHVANFCNNVGLLTILGEKNSQEDLVREHASSNVNMIFLYKADSPTIVKRRFVEGYFLQKLFEVYEMNDDELNPEQDQHLCNMLREVLPQHDLVIVVDYGHGMLTKNAIKVLCSQAPFMAVNTQANAANKGFNTISKYPRADYISLAEHEIALEERNRTGNVEEMISNLLQKVSCGHVIITRGKYGNVCYGEDEGFVEVPAFTEHVVDRIGAGDAVLAVTSLCVAQQAPMEVVGFIGNAAGAQAVAILGHQTSIERASLLKFIDSLFK